MIFIRNSLFACTFENDHKKCVHECCVEKRAAHAESQHFVCANVMCYALLLKIHGFFIIKLENL